MEDSEYLINIHTIRIKLTEMKNIFNTWRPLYLLFKILTLIVFFGEKNIDLFYETSIIKWYFTESKKKINVYSPRR